MKTSVIYSVALIAWNGCLGTGLGQGLLIPPSTIDGLTHEFGHFAPFGFATQIEDYAAAGQFAQTGFTTTLTGSELITATFEAPAGQMFVIHTAPAGFDSVELEVLGRWVGASAGGGSLSPASLSVVFENLVGEAPSLSSSSTVVSISRGGVFFHCYFAIAPGTKFTGVQLSAQYSSSVMSPVQQPFEPSNFIFSARAFSSQILDDGTLMTLEAIPEPSVLSLAAMLGLPTLLLLQGRLRRPS